LLGEIIPVTFKNRDRKVVQPVLTEDGWLSLSARAARILTAWGRRYRRRKKGGQERKRRERRTRRPVDKRRRW